ncbi:MAG: hypothetical protein NCW75_05555 [Phycisphaera sp.]|nr:MAG: hypothetical protein NCW75_05555 [Phycisphaera sp.]
MTAVRTQIVQAIAAALEDVSIIGHVAEPSKRDPIEEENIIKVISEGQAYVELGVGGDEPGQEHQDIVKKTFPITAICHLPDNPPDGVSHLEFAGQVYGAIVALLVDPNDQSVGRWGDLAEQSIDQGGGGVGLDPGGMDTLVTVVHFDVIYRHTLGDVEAVR